MPWICPNTECTYDKQLQPGHDCPLCGKEAKDFKFIAFGNLLKKKDALKKSVERNIEYERVLGRIRFCPRCGSYNVFWASGLPQLWSVWDCKKCGYRGPLIVEDEKLADKLRKKLTGKRTN